MNSSMIAWYKRLIGRVTPSTYWCKTHKAIGQDIVYFTENGQPLCRQCFSAWLERSFPVLTEAPKVVDAPKKTK